MPLMSRLLKDDPKLQACFLRDSAGIVIGATGDHVSRIQQALMLVGSKPIDSMELSQRRFGIDTQEAVRQFRHFNGLASRFSQGTRNDTIDKWTIGALDQALVRAERASPAHGIAPGSPIFRRGA